MSRGLQAVNHSNQVALWSERVAALSTYYGWQRKLFQQLSTDACVVEVPVPKTPSAKAVATLEMGSVRKVEQPKFHHPVKGLSALDFVPDNLPVDVVEHRLSPEELSCPNCGTEMVEIGKEIHRSLKIVPAQVRLQEDWYYTYACKNCEKEGTETPILNISKEKTISPGGFASPEAVAHITVQKFVMGSPLYRQEQELKRQGVQLSSQTMSNWILRCSKDWLAPVYDALHQELVKRDVLHADETTLQVLHEPGKKAQALHRRG